MREILFKGKTIKSEWVYGDLIQIGGGVLIYHGDKQQLECIPQEDSPCAVGFYPYEISPVIPQTICQFTGLTDKNGVKIFSDDLLKDKQGTIFRIYQIAGGFCAKASIWKSNIKDWVDSDVLIAVSLTEAQAQSYIAKSCEVIGNIHDT